MYLRGKPIYKNWKQLWKNGYRSKYFRAKFDEESEQIDLSLSERQLFTQSNGRSLIGQDTQGRLHFVSTPHNRIYAIPSGGSDLGGQFKGNIGQYYQTDTSLFLGKMNYEINLDSGAVVSTTGKNSVTTYLDHYLPVTETKNARFDTRVFSLAPILEKESLKRTSIHPLPGPEAVLYCMEIENTSTTTVKGQVSLSFDEKFVNQFEKYGEKFERFSNSPYKEAWEQKLLILWDPEACAAIQMLDADISGNPNNPRISTELSLEPGQRKLFTTIVSVAPERKDVHEALGIIYQHTPLEWINSTSLFWKERLGICNLGIHEDPNNAMKYRDMHIRFLIDNFNCLSFNREGGLLTNSQGAPSHGLSRSWGIDFVPSITSVMYAIPEIGPKVIEYLIERNRPRYSIYDDHSIFFLVSPLLIAQKYLELTGDSKYFKDNPEISKRIKGIFEELLTFKHSQKTLFSSRYASDLPVFKKYDYGANVQCYYALKGYKNILDIFSEDTKLVEEFLMKMPEDMAQVMEADGPFGKQITGGTNLDDIDAKRFYLSEKEYYYAGEDTTTVLAPLYGLYGFNHEPYVNLHRYARSMFLPCYDPEFQIMRELPYGMHPSATGCTIRLGGSHTRAEMRDNLNLLYERLDESGSLFWWPRGHNKKRCLTRCSQGQGQWVQQSIEQWFGIRVDGLNKTIIIQPQGLISHFKLEQGKIGRYQFDIVYSEQKNETAFKVRNNNNESFKVLLAARPFGSGTEGDSLNKNFCLESGETLDVSIRTVNFEPKEVKIIESECMAQEDGIEFGPYGIVMPKLYSRNCSEFLLRFIFAHNEIVNWKDVEVEIQTDTRWQVGCKNVYIWDYQPNYKNNTMINTLGNVAGGVHNVAGFYINLPKEYEGNSKSVMLSSHLFQIPFTQPEDKLKLYIKGESQEKFSPIIVTLRREGKKIRELMIPVVVLNEKEYSKKFEDMVHGK
ncbi:MULTISPECIES: hypothetical protein [Enterococcaceae]|uniref:Glycosyl hydrolase 36 catalytic domain-containing protein n=1 Tax=Vagococcus vulneris TaxID=1977869 RepID=A0A430A2E1_9ENTE|nr:MULTISPECIES: hypothetical protein [Enterococcaceae]EJE4563042.1 hypothetical protein [Enterococcus faecium]EJX51162.1 hypothetical protein HMPREF1379_02045 [Enterococcus faecium R497]EKZ0059232.1 hypothetical protein [Enterococcus faecium]EKZ0497274.1 hypothetical protein [Enterococcus faecium]MBG7725257.1 hypothetical protein [Enterococcus faecium]